MVANAHDIAERPYSEVMARQHTLSAVKKGTK